MTTGRSAPRLTVTLGLRYDYYQQYKQSDDKFADIYQNGFLVGNVVTPRIRPTAADLIQPDCKDSGPRFGFAYRPSFAGESGGPRRLRHLLHAGNIERDFRDGGRRPGHSRRFGQRKPRRQAEIFFNDPFCECGHVPGALNFAVSQRPEHAGQLHSAVESEHPAQTARQHCPGYGLCGFERHTTLSRPMRDLNRPLQMWIPRTPGLASLNARRPNQQFLRAVQAISRTATPSTTLCR